MLTGVGIFQQREHSMDNEQKWYFTFMQKQKELKNKYVVIEGSFWNARAKMIERYGEAFGFQYSEEGFAGQKEKYGLSELIS